MSALLADHHHSHGPANRRRRVLEASAPLFVRFPERLASTAVVVLHDADGLTERVERCCRALARRGHLVVAPYFYYDTGGREFTTDQPALAHAAWSALRYADLAADIAGALDYLDRRCGIPARSTAIVGFGAAAALARRTAATQELGAVASADGMDGAPYDDGLPAEVDRALSSTHHRREQQ